MKSQSIDTIVFDLGGVLVDWNPAHLYEKIFPDPKERRFFLENICTPDWNAAQDGGRTIAEATKILVARHPEYRHAIQAYYERWEEMFRGPIPGTLEIFYRLTENPDYKVYALTNWSSETWERGLKLFPFFSLFDGILVSGYEKTMKPEPEIYHLLLDRFGLDPGKLVFFDDSEKNVIAAQKSGFNAFVFQSPEQLKSSLKSYGVTL